MKHKKEVIAFVGPTGVGKTSSIFKLATLHSLEKKKRVGVITLDSNRIGTIEQLKVFEKIIGVPTNVVFEPKELTACLKKFKNFDLIFIDTPGINPKDDDGIKEIKRFLEYCCPTEIHLVLSATTKEKDLKDAIERFGSVSIKKLLFTKIDESSTYGSIINQLYRTKVPISYLANGQRIPGNIEDATLERLINLIANKDDKEEYQFQNQKVIHHKTIEEVNNFSDNKECVFVSTKKSLFFHHARCNRVKKIKERNILVFKSQNEANQKGLKPCKVCLKENVFHHTTPTIIAEIG
jgi:flagellar biosynthesis protein FlhF